MSTTTVTLATDPTIDEAVQDAIQLVAQHGGECGWGVVTHMIDTVTVLSFVDKDDPEALDLYPTQQAAQKMVDFVNGLSWDERLAFGLGAIAVAYVCRVN